MHNLDTFTKKKTKKNWLFLVVKFSIASKSQVKRGGQCLHGKGHPARVPDQGTDEDKVHHWWEGDPGVYIHGIDHILGRDEIHCQYETNLISL